MNFLNNFSHDSLRASVERFITENVGLFHPDFYLFVNHAYQLYTSNGKFVPLDKLQFEVIFLDLLLGEGQLEWMQDWDKSYDDLIDSPTYGKVIPGLFVIDTGISFSQLARTELGKETQTFVSPSLKIHKKYVEAFFQIYIQAGISRADDGRIDIVDCRILYQYLCSFWWCFCQENYLNSFNWAKYLARTESPYELKGFSYNEFYDLFIESFCFGKNKLNVVDQVEGIEVIFFDNDGQKNVRIGGLCQSNNRISPFLIDFWLKLSKEETENRPLLF